MAVVEWLVEVFNNIKIIKTVFDVDGRGETTCSYTRHNDYHTHTISVTHQYNKLTLKGTFKFSR